MDTTWIRRGCAIALLALAACARSTPQEELDTRERDLLASLKKDYPGAVMGFDFKGTTVDVSVDMNGLIDLDTDTEAAMKAEALKRWRTVWRETHPGEHAKLTVRFVDFRGYQEFIETTQA